MLAVAIGWNIRVVVSFWNGPTSVEVVDMDEKFHDVVVMFADTGPRV